MTYPKKCPITKLPFFMELEHPELGTVPTYGGPYDSYTIPVQDQEDGEYYRHRYDHDEGVWKDTEWMEIDTHSKDKAHQEELEKKINPPAYRREPLKGMSKVILPNPLGGGKGGSG